MKNTVTREKPFTDIPINGKSASQTPQTPETFKIEITYEPEFTSLIERIREKYGEGLLSLSGIGKTELDRTKFASRFFKTEVTADASIDPNSNLSDHSTISYSFESGKSFNKLNSLYLLWKHILKADGLEQANDITEKILRGDLYVHDLHGVESGKPYCVSGSTLVLTTEGMIPIRKIYEDFQNGRKYSAVINNEFKSVPIVQAHKKEDQALVQIRVKNGYRTSVTPDHKMLTCDKQRKEIQFKQADQILKGDSLMLPLHDGVFGTEHQYINGVLLDEDTAAMLGFLYTYASYPFSRSDVVRITFDHNLMFVEDKIMGFINQKLYDFGYDPEVSARVDMDKPNFRAWEIECKPLVDFLQSAGIAGTKTKSNDLFIHEAMFRSPEGVVRSFLKYLWGSCAMMYSLANEKKMDVTYCCWSNARLAEDICNLMYQAGTPCIIHSNPTSTNSNLALKVGFAHRFKELVGLPDFDRVANKELFADRSQDSLPSMAYYNQLMAYDGTKYLVLAVRDIMQLEGKHDVYDIGTEDAHMFLANGLLVHNCFNYSTYDVMAEGLPMVNKIKCIPPKHLFAFKSQVEQFTILASNSTLGEHCAHNRFSARQQGMREAC